MKELSDSGELEQGSGTIAAAYEALNPGKYGSVWSGDHAAQTPNLGELGIDATVRNDQNIGAVERDRKGELPKSPCGGEGATRQPTEIIHSRRRSKSEVRWRTVCT